MIVTYSEEAIAEVKDKLDSKSFYVNTSGKISFSMNTDTIEHLLQNITGEPQGEIDGDQRVGKESYSEGIGDSFTHRGIRYDINKVFELAEKIKIEQIPTNKLSWILEHDVPDPKRLKTADYKYPLLVSLEDGVYYTVDGLHRLTKAVDDEVLSLPCKLISKQILEKARLK